MKLSRRAEEIQESPIRKLFPLMAAAEKEGAYIYRLNIGQPDIETPEPYMEAVSSFRESRKVLEYGPSDGLLELREAIADYYKRYNIVLDPSEVLITTGGSEAALFAISLVGDFEDEIIVPQPFYTNYNGFATLAGMKIVPLTTKAEDGFHLPPTDVIEASITDRTRAILVCSPNNPTGTILTESELDSLAEIAVKHDLFLIGDEVYREFSYDGVKPKSLLELKGLEERVIVLDSISKRFSACGARIGAIISRNRAIMGAALKLGQARLCPPTIEQIGAIAAYRMPESYFDPVRTEYKKRRDVLYEGLTAHKGVFLKKPEGAFYMIAKLPVKDADKFAAWLLSDWRLDGETVMVAPANGFYATPGLGMDEIRIAYVLDCKRLEKAAKVLVEGLDYYIKNVE